MAGLAKPKVVVVCGPTASGKSDLALEISRVFGGEMVSADSMQIYKGLVVGTAALTSTAACGVPQHLTGFLPPEKSFSVADYVVEAAHCVAQITARGNLPVVCGGTGLYISSLLNGVAFSAEGDAAYRGQLEAEWDRLGGGVMLERLAGADPAHAARLHPRDRKRVLRSLELIQATGLTAAEREQASRPAEKPYNALCLVLDFRDRAALYGRINQRVDTMLQTGLLEEARLVYENRARFTTAAQAIGYKEFFGYFEGIQTLEDCTDGLKQATRRYAKRQLTWFRHMEGTNTLFVDEPNVLATARQTVDNFLR